MRGRAGDSSGDAFRLRLRGARGARSARESGRGADRSDPAGGSSASRRLAGHIRRVVTLGPAAPLSPHKRLHGGIWGQGSIKIGGTVAYPSCKRTISHAIGRRTSARRRHLSPGCTGPGAGCGRGGGGAGAGAGGGGGASRFWIEPCARVLKACTAGVWSPAGSTRAARSRNARQLSHWVASQRRRGLLQRGPPVSPVRSDQRGPLLHAELGGGDVRRSPGLPLRDHRRLRLDDPPVARFPRPGSSRRARKTCVPARFP